MEDKGEAVRIFLRGFAVGYVGAYIGLPTMLMLMIGYICILYAQSSGLDLSQYFKMASTIVINRAGIDASFIQPPPAKASVVQGSQVALYQDSKVDRGSQVDLSSIPPVPELKRNQTMEMWWQRGMSALSVSNSWISSTRSLFLATERYAAQAIGQAIPEQKVD